MITTRVLLLGAAIVIAARPVSAQIGEPGWQLTLHLLQMAVRGNDVHVGDAYTYDDRLSGTSTNLVDTYSAKVVPIVTNMSDQTTWLAEARYGGTNWSVGASGWRMTADGGSSGSVSSPAPASNVVNFRGVRMWNSSITPVTNSAEPSGFSTVNYHAAGAVTNRRFDLYAERPWSDAGGLSAGWRLGLAVARVENTRGEGQTQTARVVTTTGGVTQTFSNNISLEGTSSSKMTLAGPSFVMVGQTSLRRLRFDWLAGPTILIGTATHTGSWIDIDNITIRQVGTGIDTTSTELDHGEAPFSRQAKSVVPTLDLQLKGSAKVTSGLRVGLAALSSTYFGLPVAPAFSVPGDWTILEGTGWTTQHRDVTFLGVSAFAVVSF